MFSAQDILRKEIIKKDSNDTFSHTMNLFDTTDAIIITDHDKYQGMLLKQSLMEPTITPTQKYIPS